MDADAGHCPWHHVAESARLVRDVRRKPQSEPEMGLARFLTAEGYSPVSVVRSSSGLLEVPAQVAGASAIFCLDTGAIRTCFDQTSAQRLGLRTVRADDRAAGGGVGDEAGPHVALPDFSVGPCRLSAVEACVVDLSHINNARQRRGDRLFDGLLGSDVLSARAAVLDYGGLTLHLKEADAKAGGPDLATFFASGGRWTVKLARSHSGLLDLSARFGGSPLTLSLDTGAGRTCLDRATVQRLALPTRASDRRALGVAVDAQTVSYVVVQDFWIGPCRLAAVEAVVTDFRHVNGYREEHGDGLFDGLLGTDILAAHAAVLDYGALTLYLQQRDPEG